ncbi:response regulator [Endothiovibrio diazotrophicus]
MKDPMADTRIMIVEDEWLIAEDLRRNLERLGYGISAVASSGEEAVAAALRDPPSLVLMDIMLSGPMDGIDAAGVIREARDVPVIFLTAFTDQGILDRAKRVEPVGYLVKPYEERELYSTIEMALYKHAMERQLRYRLAMEELVSSISGAFNRCSADDVDGGLRLAVERIGRHAHVDCAYLLLFSSGLDGEAERCYGWCGDEVEVAERLPVGDELTGAEPLMARLRGGQAVELPTGEESGRRWLARRGVSSALMVPVIAADSLLGVLAVESRGEGRSWPEGDARLLVTVADIIAATLERRKAETRSAELARENRHLARRLISVQEEERRTLARELHDEMGQWLASIQADAQVIRTLSGDRDPRIAESAEAIADSSRRVNGVVRQMMGRLRPAVLDELGLEDGLREYLGSWRSRHSDVACSFSSPGDLREVSNDTAITIFRMVQEALTNVVRHSGADRVRIRIERSGQRGLSVVVEDNGCGMGRERSRDGMGLLGMRERVMALGGELFIDSDAATGTRLRAELPVESSA